MLLTVNSSIWGKKKSYVQEKVQDNAKDCLGNSGEVILETIT